MKKITQSALWMAYFLTTSAFALETLPEDELSNTTGQDGVTVWVDWPSTGLTAQLVNIHDTNGIAAAVDPNFTAMGDLMVRGLGIKTCTENTIKGSCTYASGNGLNFVIDTTGDGNSNGVFNDPLVNIAVNLSGTAKKIRLYIDRIALRSGAGTNEVTFLDFGGRSGGDIDAAGDYVDILPAATTNILTMELGSERPSEHMIHFSTANFGTIDFGKIILRDKNDATVNGGACAAGCNLSADFILDNVNLTGSGLDMNSTGLVLNVPCFIGGGGTCTGGGIDVSLQNVTVGNTTTTMGSFGIKGLQVTNFNLAIAGKS